MKSKANLIAVPILGGLLFAAGWVVGARRSMVVKNTGETAPTTHHEVRDSHHASGDGESPSLDEGVDRRWDVVEMARRICLRYPEGLTHEQISELLKRLREAGDEDVLQFAGLITDPRTGECPKRVLALLLSASSNEKWRKMLPEIVRSSPDDGVVLSALLGLGVSSGIALINQAFWYDLARPEIAAAYGLPASRTAELFILAETPNVGSQQTPFPGYYVSAVFQKLKASELTSALLERISNGGLSSDSAEQACRMLSFAEPESLLHLPYIMRPGRAVEVQVAILDQVGANRAAGQQKIDALLPIVHGQELTAKVRLKAARILVEIQGREASGLLLQLRDGDPDATVREGAADLLKALTD